MNTEFMDASFDMEAARQFQRNKELSRQQKNRQLKEKASRETQRLIEHIKTHYPVKRIYQWGSLLRETGFDENSDIDIAVEGLIAVEDFFGILKDADTLTTFPVDLVELEKIDSLHRDTIVKQGKLVYERE